jgi:hypothetical protein
MAHEGDVLIDNDIDIDDPRVGGNAVEFENSFSPGILFRIW